MNPKDDKHQANEKIARKLYDCFNQRDWKGLEALTDDACVVRDMATGLEYRGTDGMRRWMMQWSNLCTDMQIDSAQPLASTESHVIIEGKAHGKNDGQLQLGVGTLPATGKTLKMEWLDVVECRGGKVTGIRCYYDTGRVMSQLGYGQEITPPRQHGVPGVAH